MIFPAVHANDDQLRRVSSLKLPQLREYVDAVDSPIRPEIQHYHFAAQISKLEGSASSVNPVQFARKVGSSDGGRGREFFSHWLPG